MSDRLTEIFADVLGIPADELGDDTSPDNTPAWDSLAAVELGSLIEHEFAVKLSVRDRMKMQTIGLARTVLVAKGADGL